MIRAVVFDVDDTLTDYDGAERAGILRYLAELGVAADRLDSAADAWRAAQERHFARYLAGELSFAEQRRERAAEVTASLQLPCPDPDAWFDGYRRCYEAVLAPFADVAGCLDALRDVPLGVISNNDEAYTVRKLTLTGLLDRFDCVVGCDTFGCYKPSPEIFHQTCERLAAAPGETAYIGDRLDDDARAATAAGLYGIWLRRAGPPAATVDVPAITSLGDLARTLADA